MTLYAWAAAIALSGAVAACDSASAANRVAQATADSARADSIARARQDSINRAQPGYVVDSILPIDEEIRRFKAATGGREVTALHDASASRDALVRRIVADVANGDSVDLAKAAITPQEFIDLLYPTSPYTHAPYRQAPGLVWMSIANHSQSGYTRLVRRRGGESVSLESYSCVEKPEIQGENRLWSTCVLRLVGPQGDITTQRWFGTILERGGRFKVIGYANQF
jgi:hypothetical protein